MKGKKILAFLMVMLLVVTAVVTLVACTDGDSVNGTYYLFEDEKLQKDSFITLDGSTWKDDNGDSGSYSVNGKTITLFVEFMGEKEEFATGTVSDGVLTLKIMGADIVYCKEGKEPSSGGGDDKPPVTEKYTVTYDANGGTFTGGNSTLNQSDIASQSLLTAPSSPTRNGYNFGGWSKTKNKSDMWKFDADKVTSNITLYAVWQQESAVILSMEGASIDGRSIFMLVNSDTVRVPLANKVVCSEDSIWRLYYDELGQMEIPTKIAASQNGALYNGENVFYIVVTSSNGSQVNVYELTIHRSYEVSLTYYDEGAVLHSTSIYTGNTLKESDLYSYDKTGYTFNSWKTSAGQKYVSGEVWSSLSLYADTTANDYTVTLNTNGGDELTNKTKTVTYDSEYTLPVLSREGHVFDGWYLGSTKLTDVKGECINVWKYTSDKELTAKWIANRHSVTIESNYATAGIIKGAGEYDYGATINITIAENKGYKYLGLYNGSTLITDKTEYTFTLDDNDVKYTAKFEPVAEMANFNFTATPTSCSITSVKDKTVKSITVPSYVTGYSDGAFYGCTALESINLPISNRFRYLFKDSKGNIDMPKSLTTVVINGNNSIPAYAFEYCSGLTSITIPNSVASIAEEAFVNCSGLASITIPDSVTSIGKAAFAGCSSLTSITIGNNVTSIAEETFMNCSGLTSITIPDSVTSIGSSVFSGCTGLTSVTIGNSLTSIAEKAFMNCSALSSVTIPDSVTSIGVEALKNCSGLTSVTIPDSVTSIGLSAFYGCSSLTSVAIGRGMTSIGKSAFENCSSLASITVPFAGGSTWNNYFGFIFGASKYSENAKYVPNSLKEVIITGGESIGEYAFYDCSSLTSVTIPDSVTSIGKRAFSGCSSLTSVTFSNSVTSIGYDAFQGCSNISEVKYNGTIEQWLNISGLVNLMGDSSNKKLYIGGSELTNLVIPDSITSIAWYAFYGCSGLTSVTIPDSVTSIGNVAFFGCSGLTSVTIPDSVTSIGASAFYGCRSLTSITIPNSVTSIGASAFYGCSGLTSITIPDSVTSIGSHAFENCIRLTTVTIGSSVTSIGEDAFYNCYALAEVYNLSSLNITKGSNSYGYVAYYARDVYTSLSESSKLTETDGMALHTDGNNVTLVRYIGDATKVIISDSVTSIGNYAFRGCSGLTSITIPDSVKSIGSYAFYECYALAEIYNLSNLNITKGSTEYGYVAYYARDVYTSLSESSKLTETDGMVLHTDGNNVTLVRYIGNATSVIIPNSVTSIGESAFYGCSRLTGVTIPDSVTSIGDDAFSGCSISEVKYNGTIEQWLAISGLDNLMAYGFNKKLYIGGNELIKLVIPDSVKSIGNYAFYGCTGLTSVTIPDSVTSIGSYAFYNCTGLTSVIIGNSVTRIGSYAFYNCTGLTSVIIGNSVTSIDSQAFENCIRLTSVTIGSGVTSIGYGAFSDCSSLTSVTFENTTGWYVENHISGARTSVSVTYPSQNAIYLRKTYSTNNYYWKRK